MTSFVYYLPQLGKKHATEVDCGIHNPLHLPLLPDTVVRMAA